MATFSLDDIRSAAEAKYGSTDIELGEGKTLVLQNPLRLDKATRKELTSIQDDSTAEGVDTEDTFEKILRLVAKDKAMVDEFLAEADLAMTAHVFDIYSKASQVGEA